MSDPPGDGSLPRPLRIVFGDRLGLAVFLVGALFLGFTWRTGFFIVDSRTVANLVANVADGRLAVVEAPYSLTAANQPGLVETGGRLYGRNYGAVYLAVPATWLFRAIDGVLVVRVGLAGLWSLGLLALGWTASGVLDRPWLTDAAAIVALTTVAASILVRTPLSRFEASASLLGLQLTTILVAAFGGTVLYRLLADDRILGAAAGLGLVLATPIGFWGTIPKRHVFTATLLLAACLCFAASTRHEGRRAVFARGGAYAAIAFLGSIHAFEAAFMLAVLVPIDLATHRSAPMRDHALVAVIFLVAALPVLATNLAIAGDPLTTPRMLPAADGNGPGLAATGGTSPDTGATAAGSGGSTLGGPGSGSPSESSGLTFGPLDGLLNDAVYIGGYMTDALASGIADVGRVGELYHTVVRSGWIPGVSYGVNGWEAVELSLLEAVPLLGALAAAPVIAAVRIRRGLRDRAGGSSARPVDVLALAMMVVFLVVYLPLVPLHSMITLRYLVPAVPLALFLACRLPPVRRAVMGAPRVVGGAAAGTIVLGSLGLLLGLPVVDPAVGEAVQLHGLIGLGSGTAAAVSASTWPVHQRADVVAATLGLAAGVTMLFLLSAALWQFRYGPYALDLARLIGDALPAIG